MTRGQTYKHQFTINESVYNGFINTFKDKNPLHTDQEFAKSKKFEEFIEDGIINYKIKLTNDSYCYYYVIRPQQELGPSEGVKFKTRTDFFITLTGIEKNGHVLEDEQILASSKGIAIYLDGYTYHATKENPRFYNDIQKRLAIVESGDKISWTLTWADLERCDAAEKENDPSSKAIKKDSLSFDSARYSNTKKIYERIPYWNNHKSDLIEKRNSFERLIWLLSNPNEANNVDKKIALSLSLRQSLFATPSVDENKIETIIESPFNTIDPVAKASNLSSGNFYVFPDLPDLTSICKIVLAVKVSDLVIKSSVAIHSGVDNLDKEQWEKFWVLFNLIQNSCVLFEASLHSTHEYGKPEEDGKYDCLENFDQDLHLIIKQLIDEGIVFDNEGSFF
ncbi:MAG: hypothetical protein EOO04_16025, partial [Chitinophagaceae bacterium]